MQKTCTVSRCVIDFSGVETTDRTSVHSGITNTNTAKLQVSQQAFLMVEEKGSATSCTHKHLMHREVHNFTTGNDSQDNECFSDFLCYFTTL